MTAPTILIVDDEAPNRKLLEALLRPEGYLTVSASNGEEALAAIARQAPDLILLDIMMPGMDGYQIATILKANAVTANIPIILVTAHSERSAHMLGLAAGAEEFLTKPVDRSELWLRVRNLLRLKAYADRDIAERKAAEQRLHQLAHYDTLTGLANRTLFHETLTKTLAAWRGIGVRVAVLRFDLDHFQNINSQFGRSVGDELLRQFAQRLLQCLRSSEPIGRLGGDEFALVLVLREGAEAASAVAGKILASFQAPFEVLGSEIAVTVSIGISMSPLDASDPDTLLKHADTAMYQAKAAGRNTFRFFTEPMNTELLLRLELEAALRKAVENCEFELHYQPKVQVASGCISGFEALLRWQRPGHGLVPPSAFIATLEEIGLIVRVGSWVIAAACRQIGEWRSTGVGEVHISVNVSGRQFSEGDVEGDVVRALDENRVPAELLELELTESTLMLNTDRTIASLQRLRKRGVQISIDDFGTGYSSLAYLRRFPLDKLKVDTAFIREVTCNPDDAAIVRAIVQMAHSLNLEVIAEGVETAAQLEYLRRNHCDQIQGYYFSRALPLTEVEALLREGRNLGAPVVSSLPALETLLLVNDETDVAHSLQRILRQDGYRILTANSAAEGFEILALHPVQVVVCDQRMPGMSGTAFLDRVKELHPATLRIILSGYADLASIIDSINRGAIYRFFTKPWDTKLLRANIREAFRHYWLMNALPDERSESAGAENRAHVSGAS